MNAVRALSGLGCPDCGRMQLSGVADYDVINIGGKQYSANAIVDAQLIANRDVKLYRGAGTSEGFTKSFATVKAGQPIGKVYSYLKASSNTGQIAGGPLLMFYDSGNQAYYVKDDNAIDQNFLKAQGADTVQEELKKEKEEEERQNDPISYYIKKFGLPVLLIGGGIYLAAQLGKEAVKAKLS